MKNKCFCKKLLYILLMIMMLTISLTACGEKDRDDDEDRKSRKEKTVDDDEDKEEDEEEDEDSDEDEPESTSEPTPEPIPESTPEPTPEPVKWEQAYDDFFEEYGPVLKECVSLRAESDFEGLIMNYAYNNNVKGMAIFTDDGLLELYGTLDGLYCDCVLDFDRKIVYTPIYIDDLEEFGDIFLVEVLLEQINHISYESYIKEAKEDGILYDVVKGVAKDNRFQKTYDVECYINREKQEISKIDMKFKNDDVLHLSISYLDENEMNDSLENIIFDFEENGEVVDLNELKEIYFNFLDGISLDGESDDDDSLAYENWTSYYESYFNEPVVFPDSYGLVYNMDMYGISIDFRATVINGETWIRYGLGESTVDAYFDDNILLVGSTDMDSVDWALAYLDSSEQVDDIFNMDFWGGISGQIENVNYIDYIGSEEINGTVYDVVEIEFADDTPGQAYINREKQSIYKFSLETEGMEIEFILEDYDPIKIPYAATEAEEMSVDEISDYFLEIVEMAVAKSFMY